MDQNKIKGNLLDRTISFFAPTAGAKRIQARFMQEIMVDNVRSYQAGSNNKKTAGWHTPSTSANAEIAASGYSIRNRARDLVRNNSYSSRAVNAIASNVIGSGVRPSFTHKEEGIKDAAKELWKSWAEKAICDFDGNLNFYGLQYQIMRAVAESGEVLVRRIKNKKGLIPFQLQVLEADFLDDGKDGMTVGKGGNYIQMGIEFNNKGQRVAYWLFPDHPGENKVWKSLESQRVPASEIIHCYFAERPGQIRGVPFGVSAFLKLKDFAEYEDAQLIRQKIAACFSVFITSSGDIPLGTKNPNGGPNLERVEPGIIEHLQPGQEVSFGDPPTTEGYDIYARKMLQGIAAGYGVTYETLTNDLSNVNFSSGRMGWIEFGRTITQYQNQIIITKLCEGVFKWFVDVSILTGGLPDEVKVNWTAPRREMIDPVKEIKGYVEAVRAGFRSRQDVIRELGGDYKDIFMELIEDKEMADGNGLMLTTDAEHDSNRANEEKELEGKIEDKIDDDKTK